MNSRVQIILEAEKVTDDLADFYSTHIALSFLSRMKIIQPDAILKGCRKYVKDRPHIKPHLDVLLKAFPELSSLVTEIQKPAEVTHAS